MLKNAQRLMGDFHEVVRQMGLRQAAISVTHEPQPAPHRPHALPSGKCAVYVFTLCSAYGDSCPVGAHRALKVGKAGPNSNARFQSQHYNPRSAQSNLAASLIDARVLWPFLGLRSLKEEDVKSWIMTNADRDNLYLDEADRDLLAELERYVKGILGPVFEGG